jgi:hypothetical protein
MVTLIKGVEGTGLGAVRSGALVRLSVTYDAEDAKLVISATSRSSAFAASIQATQDGGGEAIASVGADQTQDVWLAVRRLSAESNECWVDLRVGESDAWPILVGVSRARRVR